MLEINLHYSPLTAWVHDQIMCDLEDRGVPRDNVCFVASPRIGCDVFDAMERSPRPSPVVLAMAIHASEILIRNAVTGELLGKIINLPNPCNVSTKVGDASELPCLQSRSIA